MFLLTPKHTLVLQGSCCCCRLGCHVHSFIHLGCEEHPVLHAKWCESDRDPTLLVGKRGVTGTKRRERERERERGARWKGWKRWRGEGEWEGKVRVQVAQPRPHF